MWSALIAGKSAHLRVGDISRCGPIPTRIDTFILETPRQPQPLRTEPQCQIQCQSRGFLRYSGDLDLTTIPQFSESRSSFRVRRVSPKNRRNSPFYLTLTSQRIDDFERALLRPLGSRSIAVTCVGAHWREETHKSRLHQQCQPPAQGRLVRRLPR
jgi:hypothetical protein